MTRVIICGCRQFNDQEVINRILDKLLVSYPSIEIISGHAKGVDTLAENYAKINNYPCKIFPANWDKYGKKAGPIRNSQMLKYALKENPIVIAFWDGKSRGTKNMIDQAKNKNVHTYIKYI